MFENGDSKSPFRSCMFMSGRKSFAGGKNVSALLRIFQKERPNPTIAGQAEYVVVCLGNPGVQYEKTRHNAGFVAADYFAQKRGFRFERRRFESLTGMCVIRIKGAFFEAAHLYEPVRHCGSGGSALL
jgi:hypothetical protein